MYVQVGDFCIRREPTTVPLTQFHVTWFFPSPKMRVRLGPSVDINFKQLTNSELIIYRNIIPLILFQVCELQDAVSIPKLVTPYLRNLQFGNSNLLLYTVVFHAVQLNDIDDFIYLSDLELLVCSWYVSSCLR